MFGAERGVQTRAELGRIAVRIGGGGGDFPAGQRGREDGGKVDVSRPVGHDVGGAEVDLPFPAPRSVTLRVGKEVQNEGGACRRIQCSIDGYIGAVVGRVGEDGEVLLQVGPARRLRHRHRLP